MQSFLGYRRLRDAVQDQLKRDKPKVSGRGHDDKGDKQQGPQKTTTDSTDVDLEKNEYDHAESSEPRQRPHGVKPGEVDPDTSASLPHEEEDTMAEDLRPEEYIKKEEEERMSAKSGEESDESEDHQLDQLRRTLSRTMTEQSANTALGTVLTGINIRKRTSREGGEGNVFVVGWDGPDDPQDPHNWSFSKRMMCTLIVAAVGCVVGFASAIDSSVLDKAARDFGVTRLTESNATGLFLIGFGLGALFAGPFSETLGRTPIYISTLALYMIFVMASALAPNIQAQLVFRLLAGIFGSTPLTCAGGSISDLWSPRERVFAFPIFANAAFSGPLLGPVIGGFIAQSSVSWRWVEWTTLMLSGLVLIIVLLFQPETYPPVLLKWKAKHLRDLTGDSRYKGELEIRQESLTHRLRRALYRPFLLTSREPIIILIALYLTIVYIILFTFLDGYTYIFEKTYGISPGLTGLAFLGIVVGLCCATGLVPIIYGIAKRELENVKARGGTRLAPEIRLWYSMLGGSIAIPISLFWMAWTDYAHISIWSPLLASTLFGYGILCVFITSYQYIIDSYESFAASALASITLIRYVAAGVMTVVGIPMYENLGVHWTLTLMACLGAVMAPLPYVFNKYGPRIRAKSKYAVSFA